MRELKFKVGDLVELNKDSKYKHQWEGVRAITKIDPEDIFGGFIYNVNQYWYRDEDLDLVKPAEPEIITTTDSYA